MIEVERVVRRIQSENGFREKVFSETEITYCETQGTNRGQNYAARFCAKEAFLKATGRGLNLTFDLNQIEIRLTAEGKPELNLLHDLASLAVEHRWSNIYVSLTHLAATAAAVVIIETTERTQ